MKLKDFLIGFLVGVAATVCYFMLSGCGDEAPAPEPDAFVVVTPVLPDAKPPQTDLLPDKIDPVQACWDIAKALGDKMVECTGDPIQAAKFQKELEDAWDCPNIKVLRDGVEFYTVCLPAIKALSCVDLQSANVPKSCQSQLE